MQIGGANFNNVTFGSAAQSEETPLAVLQRQYQNTTVRVRESTRTVLQQVKTLRDAVQGLEKTSKNIHLTRASGGPVQVRGETLSLETELTDERTTRLADVDDFAGVSAGSFTLGGVSISIDPSSDSLSDVLDRINAAGVGVVAGYSSKAVVVRGTDTAPAVLAGDTSGFWDAIGIEEGALGGEVEAGASTRGSRQGARKLAEAIAAIAEPLNAIFAKDDALDADIRLDRISVQSKLRGAIRTAFADRGLSADKNDLGFVFDISSEEEGGPVLGTRLTDVRALEEGLRKNPRELRRLLFGSSQHPGLLDQLVAAADAAAVDLEESLAESGTLLGTYA